MMMLMMMNEIQNPTENHVYWPGMLIHTAGDSASDDDDDEDE